MTLLFGYLDPPRAPRPERSHAEQEKRGGENERERHFLLGQADQLGQTETDRSRKRRAARTQRQEVGGDEVEDGRQVVGRPSGNKYDLKGIRGALLYAVYRVSLEETP